MVSWTPHIAFAYDLVADLRPRELVELGTHGGESYFAFCQSVEENRTGTTCYAVDTWKNDLQEGHDGEGVYADVYRHNQEFYAGFSHLVRATFDDALSRFADGSVDLIHFDGLHTYDAVRHDLSTWRRKLSPRGVALFHDIATRHNDFGAWKCWEEIRHEGDSFEFQHGWGLGVWKPHGGETAGTPLLRALFSASAAQAENIRHYYVMATDSLRHRAKGGNGSNGHGPKDRDAEGRRPVALRNWTPATPSPGTPAAGPAVQIFFPGNGSGFREENSEFHPLAPNRWERINVLLPADWHGQSLRIDPGSGFALVDIAGVRIVSDVMEQVIWEKLGGDLLDAVRVRGGAETVRNPHVLRLLCAEGDPQILLPEIDLQGNDEPMRLEIGIRVRTEMSSFGHTLQDWARELRELPDLRARNQQLIADLARERAAHQEASQSLAAGQIAGDAVRAELDCASAALHAANEQASALAGELAAARAQAGEHVSVLMAEVEAARAVGRQQVAAVNEQLAAAHEAAQAQFVTLTTEIEGVRADGKQQVAALTDQLAVHEAAREHADRQRAALEEQLAAERARHDQQAAEIAGLRRQVEEASNLRGEFDAAREQVETGQNHLHDTEAELRELREDKVQWEQDREFLRQEIAGLHSELQAQDETLVNTSRQQADTHAALAEIRLRAEQDHGRVRSMQRSASWKLTLPLRVASRALTGKRPGGDNGQGTDAPMLSAADMAGQNGGYRFQLDFPTDWNVPMQHARMRGWCLPPAGGRVPTLRIRCGDRTAEVPCDVARPDVQAAFGGEPGWHLCGFDRKIDLPGGPSQLSVEAVDEDGRAWLVGQYKVRAPYAAWARQDIVGGNPATDYSAWIDYYDALSADDRRRIRAQARELPYRPVISVVMPVYNTPERWLTKAIDSVRRQLYPFWELCIADDHSPKGHVREILSRYERLDPRIKVCYREKNGHISAASNSALELATGEFVALLDHDDELAIQALYAVALELQDHPEADLIYSDEDKLDDEGKRFSPYFKPQWNPDLLLGQNFISHLGVYRREVVTKAGGFRAGYEGCQDWDLALRIAETIPAERIRHIPRVLYHWRAIEGSTARAVEEKDYIVEASRRVLSDHCERTGKSAEILPVLGSHFRVRYRLPATPPLVSIVIPTHNQPRLLRQGIEALRAKTTYGRYEILVVDNRSDDPAALAYLEELDRQGGARVLRYPKPFNYSAINNFAVAEARGELVCLMNNDMEVITPDWLEEMASQALRPGIGAVGALLYYPDDTIQHAGVVLGLGGVAGHIFNRMPRNTDGYFNRARLVQNFTAVTAACLVVRRESYQQVGGLNETLKVAFNDVDFCLKLHAAGLRNLWTPHAEFYHHESASRGSEDTTEKHRRFVGEVEYMQAHWHAAIADDPAYNLNLGTEDGECRLASPPRLPLLRTRALPEPGPPVPAGVS